MSDKKHDVEDYQESLLQLLAEVEPGATVTDITSVGEAYANNAYDLRLCSPTGVESRFVVKRYAGQAKNAELEYQTLALLQSHQVRVPEPVFLDAEGLFLGAPTIVTRHIGGESMWTSPQGLHCAGEMARMLARIHSVLVDDQLQALLLDANRDALWFVKPEGIPTYMADHPDGQAIWQAIPELLAARRQVVPTLVHLDFWMGNVLWDDMRISAVLDWEEAAFGDPAVDVGYCRMDMFLSRMGPAAADELLRVYEAEMGHTVENLSLWEFAAAPRCMHDPDWELECRQELRDFIGAARRRSGF